MFSFPTLPLHGVGGRGGYAVAMSTTSRANAVSVALVFLHVAAHADWFRCDFPEKSGRQTFLPKNVSHL